MPFTHVNGIDLHYEIADFTRPWEGEPQTLVFLHGLHGHLLVALVSDGALCAAFSCHCGRSTGPWPIFQAGGGRDFIEAMADDLFYLLRLLDVEQVHLCGASMGGMVSLQFALAYPERVRSLALVDSYPYTPKVIRDAIEIWIVDTEAKGYGKS